MLPYLIAGAIGFGIGKLFENGGETFMAGGMTNEDIVFEYPKDSNDRVMSWINVGTGNMEIASKTGTVGQVRDGHQLIVLKSETPNKVDYHILVDYLPEENKINMVRGKFNSEPSPKYQSYINDLFRMLKISQTTRDYQDEDIANQVYVKRYLMNNFGNPPKGCEIKATELGVEIHFDSTNKMSSDWAMKIADKYGYPSGNFEMRYSSGNVPITYVDTSKLAKNTSKSEKGYFNFGETFMAGGNPKSWSVSDLSNGKYLGYIEFQDNSDEYHYFEIMETDDRLVFGGMTNTGFIESGYIEKDGFSTDETLQSLIEDLEVYYNDGGEYTSQIVFNERMENGGETFMAGGRITKYVQLYFVQGNYGQGWEDLTAHDNRKDARAEMRVYDDNESYPHRVIQRRVLRTDYEKGNYANGGGVEYRIGGEVDKELTIEQTRKIAQETANILGTEFSVTKNSVDVASFDLDLNGEEFEGGSYLIMKNGDVLNVALPNNPVYYNYKERSKNPKMIRTIFEEEYFEDFDNGGVAGKTSNLSSVKRKYLKNENENAHSENVVLLAENFGDSEDLKLAREILKLHNTEGHLSTENGKKRQELHLKLIKIARKKFGQEGIEFDNGGEAGKYSIIVWETEEDRDAGESFVAEILTNKQEALEKAEKMYYKQDFSAIEVIDENDEVILHLSSNEEEDYAKGGVAKKRRRSASAQYGRSNTAVDKTRVAKPVGYRFTNAKASELRKDPYAKPTEAQVKKYLGKGIYKENRKRHSDKDRNEKL